MNENQSEFVTADGLFDLAQQGKIDEQTLEEGLQAIGHYPTQSDWEQMLSRLLLSAGVGLSIAGIFFFFVYNWENLGKYAQLGLVGALLLGGIIAGYFIGIRKLEGKLAMLFSSVMVGIFLVVYARVFEIESPEYRLFMLWSIFIALWVFFSQFTVQWMFWIGLINIALAAYLITEVELVDPTLVLAALNIGFVAFGEWGLKRNFEWYQSRWWVRAMAAIVLYAMVRLTEMAVVNLIFNPSYSLVDSLTGIWQIVFWAYPFLLVVALIWIFYYYRLKLPELFMIVLACISIIVVVSTIIGSFAIENLENEIGLGITILLLGVLVLVQSGVAFNWIRGLSQKWEDENGN